MNAGNGQLPRWSGYAVAAFAGVLLYVVASLQVPVAVGDSSEYYAMQLAWRTTGVPWMTEPSWAAYEAWRDTGEVISTTSGERLRAIFGMLVRDGTADFNHFWAYSGLAALVAAASGFLLTPHAAFIVLNALLFFVAAAVGYRTFGAQGLMVAIGVVLLTPLLWFIDKAHTELFTVALAMCAVFLLLRARWFAAAAALALAGTQNISILGVAAALTLFAIWQVRRELATVRVVAWIMLIAVLGVLHPTYYLARIGAITPQLVAGGAEIGANLGAAFVWLFDPDLGLFPNWPLGILVLVTGLEAARREAFGERAVFAAFAVLYLAVNLFAHASTQNINSGATVDVARYALWYLPIVAGLALPALERLRANPIAAGTAIVVVALFGTANTRRFDPHHDQRYLVPTRLSAWIQARWPGVYDPPPEVFAERNSGDRHVEDVDRPYVVLGPGCRKILWATDARGAPSLQGVAVYGRARCGLSVAGLGMLARRVAGGVTGFASGYHVLDDDDALAASIAPGPAHDQPIRADQPEAVSWLGDGWSYIETWGVWSRAPRASIVFVLPDCPASGAVRMRFTYQVFMTEHNPDVTVRILRDGVGLANDHFSVDPPRPSPGTPVVAIPCDPTRLPQRETLWFELEGGVRPVDLRLSSDERVLGIGLTRIQRLD